MRLPPAASTAVAAALLLFAGLIALGGFIDLLAKPNGPRRASYSPPGSDPGVGLQRFEAFGLLGWPTPAPTPVPPPATEPPPLADDAGDGSPPVQAPPGSPVAASENYQPATLDYQDYGMANGVLIAVNSARAAQGMGPLSENGALMGAAQNYAQLLTQLDTLAHDLGGGMLVRLQGSGYPGGFLGEALWEGWGRYVPEDVVNGWLNSPPHRDILLNASFSDAGIACYVRSTDGALITRCVLDVGG
jgi:uncharacterized protein YkwD